MLFARKLFSNRRFENGRSIVKNVLIMGDSHVGCINLALKDATFRSRLKQAYTARVVTNGNVIDRFVLELADGETILNPIVSNQFSPTLKLAKTFWADNHVFLYFGSVEHNRYALVKHDRPFDFFDEHGEGSLEGTFVTRGLVRAFFEEVFAPYARGIEQIAELSGRKFFVVQGPPPPPEIKLVEDYLRSNRFVAAGAKEAMMQKPFRRKMYEVAVDVLRSNTEKHGGVFVPAPAEAFDKEGMLRADLVADPFHANADYGRLLLTSIDRSLA
jgi:hypothetical protein